MKKPYTVSNNPFFEEEEKEKFLNFLVKWGIFYETVPFGDAHISALVEKAGILKKDFEELIKLEKDQNVYEAVQKAWKYAKRPLTKKEICSVLHNEFSETNIQKQIAKLSKNNMIKSEIVKVQGKEIEFYRT